MGEDVLRVAVFQRRRAAVVAVLPLEFEGQVLGEDVAVEGELGTADLKAFQDFIVAALGVVAEIDGVANLQEETRVEVKVPIFRCEVELLLVRVPSADQVAVSDEKPAPPLGVLHHRVDRGLNLSFVGRLLRLNLRLELLHLRLELIDLLQQFLLCWIGGQCNRDATTEDSRDDSRNTPSRSRHRCCSFLAMIPNALPLHGSLQIPPPLSKYSLLRDAGY